MMQIDARFQSYALAWCRIWKAYSKMKPELEVNNPPPVRSTECYALDVNVKGATSQEAWANLLDLLTYAIECKNAQDGLWPHMVSTNGGKITVKAHNAEISGAKNATKP